MIPHVTRRVDAGKLVGYLAGPGRANEHEQQRVIGGFDLTGPLDRQMVRDVVQYLRAPGQAFPGSVPQVGEFWHCSLSLTAGDPVPTDAQWREIAEDFMRGMGFDRDGLAGSRWVVVGHGNSARGNPHIHLAASVVREDGRVVDLYRDPLTGYRDGDYKRTQRQCNRIEHERGLRVLESRDVGISRRGVNPTAFAKARKAGVEVEQLELLVRGIAADPRVLTEAAFARRIRDVGLNYRPYPRVGTPTGYSVNHPSVDVWFPGGSLGRDMTLPKLQAAWKLDAPATDLRPTPAAWIDGARELQGLETKLSAGGMSAGELADAAHSVGGLLASASQKLDDPQIRTAARECGRMAGPRKRHLPSQRHAVSTAMLLVMASDPTSMVGYSIMVRQLLNTFKAVKAAHHQMGLDRRRRSLSVREDSMAIATVAMTDRERRREMWDASTIRRDRTAALPVPVPPKMASDDQVTRMGELATAVGLPLEGVGSALTVEDASALIRELENAAGPDVVARIDARAAAQARLSLTPEQIAGLRSVPSAMGAWKASPVEQAQSRSAQATADLQRTQREQRRRQGRGPRRAD